MQNLCQLDWIVSKENCLVIHFLISFFLTNYEDVFLFKSRYFIVFYCDNELLCLHLRKNLEIDNHKYPPLTVKDSIYRDGTERLRLRNTGVKTEGNTW